MRDASAGALLDVNDGLCDNVDVERQCPVDVERQCPPEECYYAGTESDAEECYYVPALCTSYPVQYFGMFYQCKIAGRVGGRIQTFSTTKFVG